MGCSVAAAPVVVSSAAGLTGVDKTTASVGVSTGSAVRLARCCRGLGEASAGGSSLAEGTMVGSATTASLFSAAGCVLRPRATRLGALSAEASEVATAGDVSPGCRDC